MLAGGLVYLSTKGRQSGNNVVTTIAIAIIIITSTQIDASTHWPGVTTLIPVIATCVIIYCGGDRNVLLNNIVAQKLGAWSYSIYLYHWPLFVAWNLLGLKIPPINQAILIILSIVFGYISYRFVEGKDSKLLNKTPRILAVVSAIIAASVFVYMSVGLPYRVPESVKVISNLSNERREESQQCFSMAGVKSPECIFGESGVKVNLVVIGDSHANALLSSVIESRNKEYDSIVFIAQSSCPTVPGIDRRTRPECGSFVSNAFESIKIKYPDADVLIINRTSLYLHGENGMKVTIPEFSFSGDSSIAEYGEHFEAAIKELSLNRKVFIVTPVPEFDYDVTIKMGRNSMIENNTPISITKEEYLSRNKDALDILHNIEKRNKNVTLLDVSKVLCNERQCFGSKEGLPLYRDSNHLSESGNKTLSPLFKVMWSQVHK